MTRSLSCHRIRIDHLGCMGSEENSRALNLQLFERDGSVDFRDEQMVTASASGNFPLIVASVVPLGHTLVYKVRRRSRLSCRARSSGVSCGPPDDEKHGNRLGVSLWVTVLPLLCDQRAHLGLIPSERAGTNGTATSHSLHIRPTREKNQLKTSLVVSGSEQNLVQHP